MDVLSDINTKFPKGSLEFILSYHITENVDMKNISIEATLTPEGFPIIYGKSSEGKISDNEFVSALEYLLSR